MAGTTHFDSAGEFLNALASLRAEAQARATQRPTAWQLATLGQVLGSIEIQCVGGDWPSPAVVPAFPPMLDMVKAHAGGDGEVLGLLGRAQELLAFLLARGGGGASDEAASTAWDRSLAGGVHDDEEESDDENSDDDDDDGGDEYEDRRSGEPYADVPAGDRLTCYDQQADEATDDAQAAAAGQPGRPYPTLDELIIATHAADDEARDLRAAAAPRAGRSLSAVRTVNRATRVRRALEGAIRLMRDWVDEGVAPDDPAMAEVMPGLSLGPVLGGGVGGLVPEAAERLGRLAALLSRIAPSFRAWRTRAVSRGFEAPTSGAVPVVREIGDFETFVVHLREAERMAGLLHDAVPERDDLRDLRERLAEARREAYDWVEKLETPPAGRPGMEKELATARRELGLSRYPEFAGMLARVEAVADTMAQWPEPWNPAAYHAFLENVYEASVSAKGLALVTASEAAREVDRVLDIVCYRTANGREFAEHERRLDAPLGETIDRHLAVYQVKELPAFVDRVEAVGRFHADWRRRYAVPDEHGHDDRGGGGGDDDPTQGGRAWVDPDEAPAATGLKIKRRGAIPAPVRSLLADARADIANESRQYFRHAVDASIRQYQGRDADPLGRRVAAQFRAIRRWAAPGRTPAPAEQAATDRVLQEFAAAMQSKYGGPDGRPPYHVTEALRGLAYFVAWPAIADAESPKAIKPADAFKEMVEDAVADAECVVLAAPDDPTRRTVLDALYRVHQVTEFGRTLSTEQKSGVTAALATPLFGIAPVVPDVPDFDPAFTTRLREITTHLLTPTPV